MEKVGFNKNVGGTIKVAKENVEEVQQVNGAVTDLIISRDEDKEKVRVKGSYFNAMQKLDMDVKPGGLERIGEDDTLRRDKKLKNFFN